VALVKPFCPMSPRTFWLLSVYFAVASCKTEGSSVFPGGDAHDKSAGVLRVAAFRRWTGFRLHSLVWSTV